MGGQGSRRLCLSLRLYNSAAALLCTIMWPPVHPCRRRCSVLSRIDVIISFEFIYSSVASCLAPSLASRRRHFRLLRCGAKSSWKTWRYVVDPHLSSSAFMRLHRYSLATGNLDRWTLFPGKKRADSACTQLGNVTVIGDAFLISK